jgi:LysR family transcriptional regulator for metE and metH
VVLEATQRPLEALLDGSLDLGLTSTEPSHPRLVDIPLFRDELVLVVPIGHRLADRVSIRPEDLASERLITYDAPREELDVFGKFLWPGGVEPLRTQRVPLTEAMVELVAAGCGVTALATWALKPNDAKVRTVRLGPRGLQRTWRAVHLRTRAGLEPIQQFVAVVRGLLPSPVTGLRPAAGLARSNGRSRAAG